MIKNIEKSKIFELKNQVQYLDGQIISKTLCQNQNHSLTIFAFDKGEEISSHDSSGDAFVTILDGSCQITIDKAIYNLVSGDSIVMPAKISHALKASEKFKMLLTVLFN